MLDMHAPASARRVIVQPKQHLFSCVLPADQQKLWPAAPSPGPPPAAGRCCWCSGDNGGAKGGGGVTRQHVSRRVRAAGHEYRRVGNPRLHLDHPKLRLESGTQASGQASPAGWLSWWRAAQRSPSQTHRRLQRQTRPQVQGPVGQVGPCGCCARISRDAGTGGMVEHDCLQAREAQEAGCQAGAAKDMQRRRGGRRRTKTWLA